jgi:hypothetical protein
MPVEEIEVFDAPVTEVAAGPARLLVVVVVCAAAGNGRASKSGSAEYVIRYQIPVRSWMMGITGLYGPGRRGAS